MSFLRSRRGLVIVGVAVLLALFLVRPGATRLKTRIASSVGLALQRQVEIGSVRLRLLPQPGFELENFVVHDDPAYGAEPVLRAQEVTAFLRLSSLLRGRLEISRLSLTEPSLNLTRNDDGHWNIERLLERTAEMAVAPTSKPPSESRPAFPYIEAERGRINFKFGAEKKPFALTEANYSFWQDSENAWSMRLRAQPLRTDFNLSDMGRITVSGTWLRAATLRQTPIQFNLRWDEAQLGQLTKLLSGQDRGWRGTVRVTASVAGTPANLAIRTDSSLEDFRRYDIVGGDPLILRAHCDAHYSTIDHGFHTILCNTPVGEGTVAVSGEFLQWRGPRSYDLNIAAEKVPLQSLLSAARHAKKNLPDDLLAGGKLEAHFRLHSSDSGLPVFEGDGQATNVRLVSAATKSELVLETLPFSLVTHASEKTSKQSLSPRHSSSLQAPDEPRLAFGPVPLKLGRPAPVIAEAWITRSGYNISLDGEADVQRLLDAARIAGVPAAHPVATGSARVNLLVAGQWSGFAGPKATGTAQLHSVLADVRGLNQPIEITTANLSLSASETRVEAISASIADSRWTGSLSFPRSCSSVQSCPIVFDLHADEIVTDKLNDLLKPSAPKSPWYRFLSSATQAGPSFLARAHAAGKLSANRVAIRNLVGTRVTAQVDLNEGQVHLSDVRADVLGGKHRGDWRAAFTTKPVVYSGAGTLESVSLDQIAEAMRDNWISGTASGKYKIEMTGLSSAELAGSANGTLRFSMRDGALPHITLAGSPLHVRRFAGRLDFHAGEVEMQEATLDSPTISFAVTGTASLNRKLDFKLVQDDSSAFNVTGTISEPRVVPAHHAEARAALKP